MKAALRSCLVAVLLPLLLTVSTLPPRAAPQAVVLSAQADARKMPVPEVQALLDAGNRARRATPSQLDQAEQRFTEALAEARKRHDVKGESEALRNLGVICADRTQSAKA